jgi:hypothetical protein
MSNRQHHSSATRVGIAIGFAAFAIAAIVSNANAGMGSAQAAPLPASATDLGAQVDWSSVQPANITPAETVAAYER